MFRKQYFDFCAILAVNVFNTKKGLSEFVREHSTVQGRAESTGGGGGGMGGMGGVTGGPDPPLENYKNIGFLGNTGPDSLKITNLPCQHSMLGHHQPSSETPFKWNFAGWPLMAPL